MQIEIDVPRYPSDIDDVDHFRGLPVEEFPTAGQTGDLPDPASVVWRMHCYGQNRMWDWVEEDPEEYWNRFIESVPPEEVRALVFGGSWYGCEGTPVAAIEALVEASSRLVNLEAVFLGGLGAEECGVSLIEQCDLAPLLEAYPRLQELWVRGTQGLAFPVVRHEGLRTLRFESGGLPAEVTRNVAACDLPSLEYLELWLGDENYGCDTTLEDLRPLLDGERLPSLRHFGLQNSHFQDEIAAAVAQAPVVVRLESLRLSMGTLSDEGATALLSGQPLTHLRFLDLRHHYLSDAMMLRVWDALEPEGVRVDLSRQGGWNAGMDDNRYVNVSE
ncbi:STM4015 family protein [Streptomyces prasinus]